MSTTMQSFFPHRFYTGLACLLCAVLSACKVIVIVPEGGKVITAEGFVCLAGETCEIDISDTDFDSTFTAMPDEGVTFQRWQRKPQYLCGGSTAPCRLSTTGFPGNENLMAILASDDEFFLEPIFIKYDVAYWKQVLAQIDRGSFATDAFLYAAAPIVDQCDPGLMKQSPKSRSLESLNEVRALHRLPGAAYNSSYDSQVQQSSLVQRASMRLNHFPSPADKCYSQAARDGASTSNLSGGTSGRSDPAEDIFGWTNDNNNQSDLMEAGHRRWMLDPQLSQVAYGQVEGYATLKVFGFNASTSSALGEDLDFVAMPFSDYPYVLVSQPPQPTPWSISMVPPGTMSSKFNYFASAQVSVTEKDSGNNLHVHSRHTDTKGFGLANFLSWMVDGWEYDRDYTVLISNVSMPDGSRRDIEYPVRLDRYSLFNTSPPREPSDSKQNKTLKGQFNTPKDEDGHVILLADPVRVTGNSEFSNWGFYVRIYNSDKQLVKSSDQPFSMDFPYDNYSVIVSRCNENGSCYQGTKNYTVSFN